MAKYSIRELYNFKIHDDDYRTYDFLFSGVYAPPADPEATDTRPEFIKSYVDANTALNKLLDNIICEKYSDFYFMVDCDTVSDAYYRFINWNCVYVLTHNTELSMLYKAHTVDYNPIENYDRNEETTVASGLISSGTTMVAPDDSELFTNVGSGTSNSNGTQTTTGHIHGNIGVTTNAQMQAEVYKLYQNNSWIDYFISTLISDSCIIFDNGYNTI